MCVLGLDLSLTSAGICELSFDDRGHWSAVRMRSVGTRGTQADSWHTRGRRIVSQVITVLRESPRQPDLAVIEGPSYGASLPSAFDRAGLWWGVASALQSRGVPVAVTAPRTRARYACADGGGDKKAALAGMRALLPTVEIRNHDQADALALACIGAQRLGAAMPFDVRVHHTQSVESTAWPEDMP